jgi:hypothetical protein
LLGQLLGLACRVCAQAVDFVVFEFELSVECFPGRREFGFALNQFFMGVIGGALAVREFFKRKASA